jgi:parvulin-like peptidyl-prolyl isomerase
MRKRRVLVLVLLLAAVGCRRTPSEDVGETAGSGAAEAPAAGSGEGSAAAPGAGAAVAPGLMPAATVNGVPVMTRDELDAELAEISERYARLPDREPPTAEWRNERRRRIVQGAVHDRLVADFVAGQGVVVTDQQVEDAIRADIEHVYDDERLFERYLRSQNKTREQYFAEVRDRLAVDAVLAQRGTLEPTDAEIQEFYDRNAERWNEGERALVSNITVRVRQGATPEQEAEARTRAENLRGRVLAGEAFDVVARESSESVERVRGGDMGWIVRGRRRELIDDGVEDLLFRVSLNQPSEVVRTRLGFQFFAVSDRRDAGVRALDEVREIIYEPLRRRTRDRLRLELVNELIGAAQVQYLENNWGIEAEGAIAAPVAPEGSSTP